MNRLVIHNPTDPVYVSTSVETFASQAHLTFTFTDKTTLKRDLTLDAGEDLDAPYLPRVQQAIRDLRASAGDAAGTLTMTVLSGYAAYGYAPDTLRWVQVFHCAEGQEPVEVALLNYVATN